MGRTVLVQPVVLDRAEFRAENQEITQTRRGELMMGILRKQRIFRETVKDAHTSHWDLDLLSSDELAAVMGKAPGAEEANVTLNRAKKVRTMDK